MKSLSRRLLVLYTLVVFLPSPEPARAGRLAPDLTAGTFANSIAGQQVWLRVVGRRDESGRVLHSLHRLPPSPASLVLASSDATGRDWVWLRVPAEQAWSLAQELAGRPGVEVVEHYRLPVLLNDDSTWLLQSGDEDTGRTVFRKGLTGTGQVVGVADSGLDADACQFRYGAEAEAVTTAIAFPQPPLTPETRPENKVVGYFVIGQAEAYDDASGGFHGTHTTGCMAGDDYQHLATASAAGHDPQDGMAPGAQIVFQDIGANDGNLMGLLGVSMYDLLLQAWRAGARVHNNSYGSPTLAVNYDSDSAAIDEACWRLNDLVVVFAAGNSGADQNGNLIEESLGGTGSTAKNTVVVGASGPVRLDLWGTIYYLQDDLLFFSSRGPTADGRIKPELVAPGLVFSANSDPDTAIDLGCCDYTGKNNKKVSNNEDDNCNVDQDWPTMGTSFSSPLVAGAAALVRQYFTDGFWARGTRDEDSGFNPTNALVKAALVSSARPLSGEIVGMGVNAALTPPPSFAQGWGRVLLEDVLSFTDDEKITLVLDDVPNPVPDNPMLAEDAPLPPFAGGAALASGDQARFRLPALAAGGTLKVVLAWSDPPAEAYAPFTLVNDLDLEVGTPDGRLYRGNIALEDGLSQPAASLDPDHANNLEVVVLAGPLPAGSEVAVHGGAVPGNGEPGSDTQGYALLATGEFLAPVIGAVEPSRGVPGTGLSNVIVSGSNFVTGMQLDFGPGIELHNVVVLDEGTAQVGLLLVDPAAELGPRDVTASLYTRLRGTGGGLFEVVESLGGAGGCDCAAHPPGGIATAAWLCLLALPLVIHRRRRGKRGQW